MDEEDPLWALYLHIRNFETPSGVKLYEPFLNLPSKRELPDYYEVIDEPISLNEIRRKLKLGDYSELPDLVSDLNLMFENCKTYNRPESRLFKEGTKLQKVMNAKVTYLEMCQEDLNENGGRDCGKLSNLELSFLPRDSLRKRLQTLYNSVLNYTNSDNVKLIGMFMEKPSLEEYPDYYEVIQKPIDMTMIQNKIRNGSYRSEDELVSDMKLMFSNCRQYNEEGSGIYKDAIILEQVLINKCKEIGVIQQSGRGRPKSGNKICGGTGQKGSSSISSSGIEKIKTLFESVKEHKDSKGRQLSLIFLKLPNSKEFPEYFEVIKNPIDFEQIGTKIKQNVYNSVGECLADFILMFENACKYNEPDSQIYKDALTLQSLARGICRTIQEDTSSCPDVQGAVQDILNHIFTSMYNHPDADGRCYSDSLAELPDHEEKDGESIKALNLDLIKKRLDRCLYKRLDNFQRDVFSVLERARNVFPSNSKIFEDSVELQSHFIKVRDIACGNGSILQSQALLYTETDLKNAVESSKLSKPISDDNEEDSEDAAKVMASGTAASATIGQNVYHVGDFVYAEPVDKDQCNPIVLIERIYSKDGKQMMSGSQFFRPEETFHVPTRKFLEKEVFHTEIHLSLAMEKITGQCVVLPAKDYYRLKPEKFEDKDTFVCESRYTTKTKSFKKLKQFWQIPSHIKTVLREKALQPKRTMSVFKDGIEKHQEELEAMETLIDKAATELPPNVLWMNAENVQPGCIYYEQYTIPGPITLRRGDHVYVRSENGKNLIAQIDSMWRAESE